MEVIEADKNIINKLMEGMKPDIVIRISFSYGNPDYGEIKKLWDRWKREAAVIVEPWMICGDFNDISCLEEKSRGRDKPLR